LAAQWGAARQRRPPSVQPTKRPKFNESPILEWASNNHYSKAHWHGRRERCRPFLAAFFAFGGGGCFWGSRWFCFRRFAQTATGSRWRSSSTAGTIHTKPDVRIVATEASARLHLSPWLRKVPSTARPREPAEAGSGRTLRPVWPPEQKRFADVRERPGGKVATGSTVCRTLQTTRLVSGVRHWRSVSLRGSQKSDIADEAGNEKSGRCALGMSQLELRAASIATLPMVFGSPQAGEGPGPTDLRMNRDSKFLEWPSQKGLTRQSPIKLARWPRRLFHFFLGVGTAALS
jgi:hypothetical protein